jgi:uncharacterized membrane protein/mono/diheme cytochrome c family protein
LIDLAPFVGRFHPLLVHFPIGILLLAVAMQVVATVAARRGRAAPFSDRAIAFVLGCGAMSAVAAATTGYLLGGSGGYTGETFDRHETLGIGVAILSCVATLVALMRLRFETFLAERSSTAPPGALAAPSAPARAMPRRGTFWGRTYAATLIGVFVMLTWAGHLGATLTHGEGYLTEHAPEPVRAMLARLGFDAGGAASTAPPSVDQALVFASLVEPVLQARCVQCHGAAKMEGELRLDGPDSLRKGGKSGPAFVAGQAAKSELVRRIWLPASDSDVMPPRGQRPLTPAEASLIRWWIERGAKFDQKVMEAEISPDVRPAIEAIVGPIPIDFGGPTLPKVKVAPAAPAALANVRATGVSIVPLSADTPFVQVHCTNVRATFGDAQLAALEAIAPQILWLDVSGTQITDAGLAVVEKFPNLTRLHLHRTAITDAGVMHLARLSHLEYLNLYETKITDTGLASLAGLPSLRALYVWRTGVTTQGIDRLKASLPRLVVD